jgi:hypothetical protein
VEWDWRQAPAWVREQVEAQITKEAYRGTQAALPHPEVVPTPDRGSTSLQSRPMNKSEAMHARRLERRKLKGEVLQYEYEGLTFRLAPRTRYTPDFAVWLADGSLECHEVKGGIWRDDARVKIKVAARLYPHVRFLAFTRCRGEWHRERFGR